MQAGTRIVTGGILLLMAGMLAMRFPQSVAAATISVSPNQSIQSAINSAASGDTITVNAGTYNERINLSKSNLTLTGNGKVVTRAITVSGSNNTIQGFTASDVSADAGITVQGDNNLIQNNEVLHTGQDGIWFFGSNNRFIANYVHDILDPSIGGDPHVDCFQSWGGTWNTVNVVFEQNTCDHNRTSGSNQIVMFEHLKTNALNTIIFRNNLFIMHDAGYSPMNFARKDGQAEISNIQILNNTIVNTTGAGQAAVHMLNITNGFISNNKVYGYNAVAGVDGGTVTQAGNELYPISSYRYQPGATPTPLISPSPSPSVPAGKPGDANDDGLVNEEDYGIWKENYGREFSGSAFGDFNNDGNVNGVDYVLWLTYKT